MAYGVLLIHANARFQESHERWLRVLSHFVYKLFFGVGIINMGVAVGRAMLIRLPLLQQAMFALYRFTFLGDEVFGGEMLHCSRHSLLFS